jgi:hypothetical protein
MAIKTLTAGTNVVITQDGSNVEISTTGTSVDTCFAWMPLADPDMTNTDGAYLVADSCPSGFLTDANDWAFALRLGPVSTLKDSINALFCTDVQGGGVGIYGQPSSGTSMYWAVMDATQFLLNMTDDRIPLPDRWLVFSWDASASAFSAWVGPYKVNADTTGATFAATQPSNLVIGQEAAGYTSASFGQCLFPLTDIMIFNSTITDAEAAEFLPDVHGYASLSTGLQAKITNAWTFTATGPSIDVGSIGLTPTDGAKGGTTYKLSALPQDAAPTDIVLVAQTVSDGDASGTTVGTLGAVDSFGGPMTFALVSGAGDTDNSDFQISGTTLQTATTATSGGKSVRVQVTDSGGNVFAKAITFSVVAPALSETWESGIGSWSVANDGTNDWAVGSATANTGSQSAYISNDGGTSNAYDAGTSQVSHIYKSFTATASMELSFSWKTIGEGNFDYLVVSVVPVATTPTAGSTLSGFYNVGSRRSGSASWQDVTADISSLISSGSDYNLVFTWKNDSFAGTQPPAAIDDIVIVAT